MKYIYLSVLLIINSVLFAQDSPSWVYTDEEQKYTNCCYYYKTEIKGVDKDNFGLQHQKLIQNLKLELSKKINTNVKSTDISETRQIQGNDNLHYQNNYNSKNTISTDISLPECEIKTWPTDNTKKVKTIYGYIKLEKENLAQLYIKKFQFDKTILLGELTTNIETSNLTEMLVKINETISKLENDLNILTSIGLNENYNTLYEEFVSLKQQKSEFISRIIGKEFEDKYKEANKLLIEKKCEMSYNMLQDLYTTNPEDERIKLDRAQALQCIESNLMNRLSYHENRLDYESALYTIDSLIWISPEFEKMMKSRKEKLISGYFNYKFQTIKNVIQTNSEEAKRIHSEMNFFGSDRFKEKYNDIGEIINKINQNKLTNSFYHFIDNNQYENASSVLVQMSKDYGLKKDISNTIKRLNSKLENSIFKFEKKNLLATRPHLYCIKLGYSYQSLIDYNNPNGFSPDEVKLLTPYYSFELYKKINTKTKFSDRGRDKSRSNLIGIKLGYQTNTGSVINLTNNELVRSKIELGEAQLSGTLLRIFRLSYGVNSPIEKLGNDIKYTHDFGVRIKLLFFDLNAGMKYITDYESKGQLFYQGGLSLNINFVKKFNAEDRRAIAVKMEKWKN